jgi:hypothetical protein
MDGVFMVRSLRRHGHRHRRVVVAVAPVLEARIIVDFGVTSRNGPRNVTFNPQQILSQFDPKVSHLTPIFPPGCCMFICDRIHDIYMIHDIYIQAKARKERGREGTKVRRRDKQGSIHKQTVSTTSGSRNDRQTYQLFRTIQ